MAVLSRRFLRLVIPRALSLRTMLALLPLAAVLPMVLFALFLLNRVWEEGRTNGDQELAQLLQTQTVAIERELLGYQRELRRLGDALLSNKLDPEAFRSDAASVLSHNLAWSDITLTDASGRTLSNGKRRFNVPAPTDQTDDWLALSTGLPIYSNGKSSPATEQFHVSIALPISFERNVVGVIHGELMPGALSAILTPQINNNVFVTILDREYRIIGRSHDAERYQGQSIGEQRKSMIRAQPGRGSVQAANMSGEEHRVIWQRLSNGWTVVAGKDVDVYEVPLRRSLTLLLIVGVAVFFLGMLLSRQAGRYLERQFGSLTNDAYRLAAGDPLATRDSRVSEFHQLREALNETSARLLQAQAGRERALAALQQADHHKNEFLSILAHELRNPMAPLRNAIALLQARTREDATSQRMITLADRQLGHLIRLVDDLLDVARISRGRLELRLEPVVLQEVLQVAVDALHPRLDEHAQTLEMRMPQSPIVLNGDRVRLIQVFENLISNASKYSNDGEPIDLQVQAGQTYVQISITDRGIGIRPDDLEQIFEIYHQIENAVDRSQGGLGIGLALVRRLVVLHGGTVTARSDGPGLGSCFEVLLPR